MHIHDACAVILGDDLAQEIIEDQGTHWAVVAAIRRWNREFTEIAEALEESV